MTGYIEVQRTEDGNALVSRFYGGSGSGTMLTVYDAAAKQIREIVVTSGGTVWTHVYTKTKEGWKSKATGSNPNGDKIEGSYEVAISGDGNTHTWTGTTKIAGKQEDPLHDLWRRVSK